MALDEDVTLGVEEECLLVDPGSRALVPASRALLARSRPEVGERAMQHELYLSQVEIGTPVCRTLDELRGSLTSYRTQPWRRWPTAESTGAFGPGADRQRAAYARAGRFEDVVDQVVAETAAA